MKPFRVFCRTWWRETSDAVWPNGLEPYWSQRLYLSESFANEDQARNLCQILNGQPRTAEQERLGFKYEYTNKAML